MKLLYNYAALFLIVGMLVASIGLKKQARPESVMAAKPGGKNVVWRGDR